MSVIVCILCHRKAYRCSAQAVFCMSCIVVAERVRATAHQAVKRAIRLGEIPPIETQYCVDCGKFATGYEHRDYSNPLEVVPVCFGCNKRRGPAKYPPDVVKLTNGKFKADRESRERVA